MPELLKEIERLKSQLIRLGYHPDELEHILHENVPIPERRIINSEYLNDQIEFLRSYLQFAAKSVGIL